MLSHQRTLQPRRKFLRTGLLLAGAGLTAPAWSRADDATAVPPIVVFSKIYQSIKLSYEDSAASTAEAGLAGVDCTVRPAGEVLPERVEDDLPRYAAALTRRNLSMPLMTTAIVATDSPQAEKILRTAKKLGVTHFRAGFIERAKTALDRQIAEAKSRFKDLAALCKALGITAVIQNHSPSNMNYLGGDLGELRKICDDLDPTLVGIAFDIGHALNVHGEKWVEHFEALKSHIRIVYIKDVNAKHQWVPFGEGLIAGSGYFAKLRAMNYHSPISLHIEYNWSPPGKGNRADIVRALRESSAVLRSWWTRG